MTELPDIKLRALANFPVAVTGRTATKLTKVGNQYFIDHDVSGLVQNPNISAGDVAASWMTIWNKVTNSYQNVPYALAATSGVASIHGQTGALDIGDGLTFVGSTLQIANEYETRSLAAAATISTGAKSIKVRRYANGYPLSDATYIPGSSSGPAAFLEAGGHWWELDLSGGVYNIQWGGAGGGSATADVAAWTLATQLSGATVGGVAQGPVIIVPAGTQMDLSTGSFLFTKNGTRIIGGDNRTSVITYNPAAPGSLFTFYKAGDLTGGISNCEVSNIQIISSNAINKTILALKNTATFLIDRVLFLGITDAAGGSIGLLYAGRNFLLMRDSTIGADNPVFFTTNPDRANYGSEDADTIAFERNELVCLKSTAAIYTVSDGLNVTTWSDTDSNWAKGRYGVLNSDATASATAYEWRFTGIRREQDQGTNPTMFVIQRSGNILRNLIVDGCDAASTGALFVLSGVERADFKDVSVQGNSILIGTADATVARLKWTNLFAQSGNTISLTGQTLVRGREKMGGTNTAPIYTDATYTNTPDGTIEWIGAPSATSSRRVGLWRGCADVPVSNSTNDYQLVPWPLYTVQYAEIRVTSPTISGVAVFRVGQVAPGGNAILVGQTNFAVDGGAGHLSVFQYSDTNVCIVNKLAATTQVSVEVLFTI